MRTVFAAFSLAALMVILVNCSSSKKAAVAPAAKISYASSMQPLITTYCSPCHIPAKGGNKRAYDNYENVKQDIDEIIRRVELEPGTRGFMPFKHPKLSDSTLNIIRQWKADGLLEK